MRKLLLHKVLVLLVVSAYYLVSACRVIAQSSNGNTTKVAADSVAEVPMKNDASNKYVQPKEIEEYLNQISNPGYPRTLRKKWKEEALQLFANKSAQVLDEKNGLGNRYTAATLLDLLLDFPHQVKVSEVVRDQQDKITELHLKMDRQKK